MRAASLRAAEVALEQVHGPAVPDVAAGAEGEAAAVERDDAARRGAVPAVLRRQLELLHLPPFVRAACVAHEDVGAAVHGVGDDHDVAGDGHRHAEVVAGDEVVRFELGHLSPRDPVHVPVEDVRAAGAAGRGVPGSDHHGVDVDRDHLAEVVEDVHVRRQELLDLAPCVGAALVALEDVGRAGVGAALVVEGRPGHGGVPPQGHAGPELVAPVGVVRDDRLHQTPGAGPALVALEHVHRAGQLVAAEVVARRADQHRVPVGGDGGPEVVVGEGLVGLTFPRFGGHPRSRVARGCPYAETETTEVQC
jgi:hypothetical protein